jgi:hypothetical protein
MANTITKTERLDGSRKYVLEVEITGDGSGDETGASLIDVSGLSPAADAMAIEKVYFSLDGFSARLLWDADTDVEAYVMPEGEGGIDFRVVGSPLQNTAGTGKTGDVLLATTGLGSTGHGFIRIEAYKK